MPTIKPKISVILLNYNDKNNLKECIDSVLDQDYSNFDIIFVDNDSSDDSTRFVEKNYSQIKIIKNAKNLGYAGGNNVGMREAFQNGADFCFILNTDTKIENNVISSMLKTYLDLRNKKIKVGLIQAPILLFNEPTRVNTLGNAIHYLGFGYCKDYKKKYSPLKSTEEIISVSGAGFLISKDYYLEVGIFDESFFMYNEDQDLSWRGLIAGYRHFLSPVGKIYHKYNFKSSKEKFMWSEKNRLTMMVKYYDAKTLIKLLPILLVAELFFLGYSLLEGFIFHKIKSYYLFLKDFRKINKYSQEKHVSDLELIRKFDSELYFEGIKNRLVDRIVNPVFRGYYLKIFKG